jgi:hypothetical protein
MRVAGGTMEPRASMLDERIKARILDDHKKLTACGERPSRSLWDS